jgi:pimeloyl-ACP methyl ester carboxylesterase
VTDKLEITELLYRYAELIDAGVRQRRCCGYPLVLRLRAAVRLRRLRGCGHRRRLVLPGAGHFLQWDRADLFNPLVIAYFGDLRVRHRR